MKFNFKKIVTAACMAAFLTTSFLPGISEAANGRMSLAQAQQQVKRPLYRHYKAAPKHGHKHHFKHVHRPAMHTRGPVSRTWVPARHSQHQHLNAHRHTARTHKAARPLPPKHHSGAGIKR